MKQLSFAHCWQVSVHVSQEINGIVLGRQLSFTFNRMDLLNGFDSPIDTVILEEKLDGAFPLLNYSSRSVVLV